jgi:hypothetical protein
METLTSKDHFRSFWQIPSIQQILLDYLDTILLQGAIQLRSVKACKK